MVKPARRALSAWGFGLFAVAVGLSFALSPVGVSLEERAEGHALSARARPWDERVVIVALDDESFQALGFPFRRGDYARVLEALEAAGVKAIGLDFSFRHPVADSPQGDEALAAAMRRGKVALGLPCEPGFRFDPAALAKVLARTLPAGPEPAFECEGAIPPYGPLDGAAWPVSMTLAVRHTNANRGLAAFSELGGRRIPTIGLGMFALGETGDYRAIHQLPGAIEIAGRRLAVDATGAILVSARPDPRGDQFFSFVELLRSLPPKGPARLPDAIARRLAGRYVLLGNTTPLLNDLGPDLEGRVRPLVLMHAALLSDLIEHAPVRELPRGIELVLVLLAGLVFTAAAIRLRVRLAAVAVFALWLGCVGGALFAAAHGLIFGPIAPALTGTLAFVGALGGRLISQEREQRILKDAFGAYVSGPMLQRILDAPETHLALGGARKSLTVLFSDIQGYTGLSNQLPPEEVIALLRDYLAEMTQLVCDAGGRIDKIMGDGIMAVFGDPVADPDHAGSAVKVALAMQQTMAGLRQKWAGSDRAELAIRIGIATGEVFVGNIGSKRAKLEYTVLGPTVNLASRLEGKAPPGGVLISAETQAACEGRFALQPLQGLQLKGYEAAYEAFLVLGPNRERDDRRSSPRVAAIGEIEVTTEAGVLRAEVCNVSAFGLFLAHPSPPELGSWVKLAWRAPDREAVVRLEGVVEHHHPHEGRPGMGIALSPAVAEESGFQHLRSLYLRLTEAA